MAEYGPSIKLCTLYKCESQGGKVYFRGRMGGAKVAIVQTTKTTDDGQEIWSLLASEAPKKAEDGVGDVSGDYRGEKLDDKVPF